MTSKEDPKEELPSWALALHYLLWTVATIYDVATYIPNKIATVRVQTSAIRMKIS